MATMIKEGDESSMDSAMIEAITALNRRFYTIAAESFAASRQKPWPGWQRLIESLEPPMDGPMSLLDVGCGNLRFERFLAAVTPSVRWNVVAVDESAELLAPAQDGSLGTSITLRPVVCNVLDNHERLKLDGRFDVVTSFGLFHHVPDASTRLGLLLWLGKRVHPGSFLALSLWRFERNTTLLTRIRPLQAQATEDTGVRLADPHDWWLPWQRTSGLWRFCHSFTDDEINELIEVMAPTATLVDRFDGPGPSDRYNTYLLFQSHPSTSAPRRP